MPIPRCGFGAGCSIRETLFILDELAVLDTLSQLHTAVTGNRKFGDPMVIGTQDPAQLEVRYGAESRTILSQFKTSIILQLNDAPAQEWASKKLGDVEIQRLQEPPRRLDAQGRQHEPEHGLAERTGRHAERDWRARDDDRLHQDRESGDDHRIAWVCREHARIYDDDGYEPMEGPYWENEHPAWLLKFTDDST